jgi:hypothetical protein
MSIIEDKYRQSCAQSSDINEHLPVLREYASRCQHITETGVRSAVSSYAFAAGLLGKLDNKLVQVDLNNHPNIQNFLGDCKAENINAIFYEQSDLDCPLEKTDLLFIDTWHIYGHLKRELARWNSYVTKYIICIDKDTFQKEQTIYVIHYFTAFMGHSFGLKKKYSNSLPEPMKGFKKFQQ